VIHVHGDATPLIDVRLLVSVSVPAGVAVGGWFLAHWLGARREVSNKRREIRLKGLEAAYTRLAMAAQRDWTEDRKRDFEAFVAEIQLYGTPKQIELMTKIVGAFIRREPVVSFDALLEELRNSLRKELRMEPVTGHLWWYRFELPAWARAQKAGESPDANEQPATESASGACASDAPVGERPPSER
jgi:hypothetical protein